STVSQCVGSTRTHAETSQPPQSARHAAKPSFHVPPSSAHAVGVPGSHSSPSSTLPLPHVIAEASLGASGVVVFASQAGTQASVHVNRKSRRSSVMSEES